jgi:hypothetical protein
MEVLLNVFNTHTIIIFLIVLILAVVSRVFTSRFFMPGVKGPVLLVITSLLDVCLWVVLITSAVMLIRGRV